MSERRRRARSDERGSALLVSTVALAMAAVLGIGLVRIGDAAAERARADATADIVALASVTGGRVPAGRVAAANGATVVAVAAAGAGLEVTIEVGRTRSAATARPG